MKHNLLSNYEDFIFTSSEDSNDILAYEDLNGKITVIHDKNLLGKSNVKFINEINESKNIAFSISMENRHVKNSHSKTRQKNLGNMPILYYIDCKIKRIVNEKDPKEGDIGRIIENFLQCARYHSTLFSQNLALRFSIFRTLIRPTKTRLKMGEWHLLMLYMKIK